MKKGFRFLSPLTILNLSGYHPKFKPIRTIKKHEYSKIDNVAIIGDAPKDVVKIYTYNGKDRKKNIRTWPIYIVKLGHKYYPNESITEQLFTDIGKTLGFNMAHSILAQIGGQIRFLSKYFLETETEELVHGADMYANYLNDDIRFVDEVEEKKMTQDFFTIEFTALVFKHFIEDMDKKEEIFKDFMNMLFFDALIGNNDRHMYNWGVIRDINTKKVLKFAPIYDTARGLFWNYNEKQVKNLINDKQFSEKITDYCLNSRPKIGSEKKEKINHFDFVRIYKNYYIKNNFIMSIFEKEKIKDIIKIIHQKYSYLMSVSRQKLIKEVIQYRFREIQKILNDENN